MAFKARAVPIGNSDTIIYECPPGLEAAGKLMFSNPTATARTLTVKFFDASAGETTTLVSRQVAANSDYPLPLPPSAEQGDRLIASGDQAGIVAAYTITQSDIEPSAKGFIPQGLFDAGVTYEMGDLVSAGGSSYVSRVDDNLGFLPSASPAQWQIVASKGDTGTAGTDGQDGIDGQDGDGNVNGPASAVNNRFPAFDGASGKIIKDSGFSDASFATAAQGAKADTALQPGTTALDSRYYTEAEVDAAISSAVSAAVAGVSKRSTVRVATTGNITIATALNEGDTLNGIELVNGDKVLVKNQSAPAQNGVYVVGPAPARDVLFDTFNELAGSVLIVQEGAVEADTIWFCTSNAGGTIGTTAVSFTKLTVSGELLAANNLSDLPSPTTARGNLGAASAAQGALADSALQAVDVGTAAQLKANSAGKLVAIDQLWLAASNDLTNITGTVNVNFAGMLAHAKATMTGNVTLAVTSGLKTGQTVVFELKQDATGGRTLAHNATYWTTTGGAALDIDTTANALNVVVGTVLSSGKVLISLAGKKVI